MRGRDAVMIVEIRFQLRAFANLFEEHIPLCLDIHVIPATGENHFPILEECFHFVIALPLNRTEILKTVK